MGDVIDLFYIRRGQRLFGLFVTQHGLAHFLHPVHVPPHVPPHALPNTTPNRRGPQTVNPEVVASTVQMACEWIALLCGRSTNPPTRALLERNLRRLLITKIAERLLENSALAFSAPLRSPVQTELFPEDTPRSR